jgi:hypothetical protein
VRLLSLLSAGLLRGRGRKGSDAKAVREDWGIGGDRRSIRGYG